MLTRGTNGAIYGALTSISIENIDGFFLRPEAGVPGEYLLFSVTNKKVYPFVGDTTRPISVFMDETESQIGFCDCANHNSLTYKLRPEEERYAYTVSGQGCTLGGFSVEKDD
jgi:hypothetical protein